MRQVTVDGIYSRNNRDYGYHFYTIKPDYWESEEKYVVDGHIDSNEVFWEGAYAPVPYCYGEIDEERWMKTGVISAKDPRYAW